MIELNKVYNMDNLKLLNQIEDGSIDVVYIDPLFQLVEYLKLRMEKLHTMINIL